eukprot:scaffold20.g7748.t1
MASSVTCALRLPQARRGRQPRSCQRAGLSVSARMAGGMENETFTNLVNGEVTSGPSLAVEVNGLKLPNPFVIASGPPGTNYTVMKKAFDEGWGGVVAKTVSLDAKKVINVTPRRAAARSPYPPPELAASWGTYAKLRAGDGREVIGFENIELISDRPFETMLQEFKRLKAEYPDRILIASIMEEYNKTAWDELVERCQETGVDAFEINFSCPHGMPERKMGMAMGQDCEILGEVCGWVTAKSSVPVWAKMTPNITDITAPAHAALANGAAGIAAINTITSVMGVNLDTLRPEPCVEGYTTPGGYSSKAVKPIALAKASARSRLCAAPRRRPTGARCTLGAQPGRAGPRAGRRLATVMAIAQMMKRDFPDSGATLSGIGGVNTGRDAAEFILLGSDTVQVCTGVMLHGYSLVKYLAGGLQEFMNKHGFTSIDQFRGASLPYFTSHHELVRMQHEALEQKKKKRVGLEGDDKWTGDGFVQEAASMVAN